MANVGIARSQITTAGGGSSPAAGGDWYSVITYGAKGNGKIAYNDMTITSGTPNLTSAQGPWLPGDAGKVIMVAGAGANGVDLWTTILFVVSATAVTLATNASTTLNPAGMNPQPNHAVWGGTDDTTAIQNTINAAGTAGVGVYIPPGVYIISATLTLPSPNPPFIFGQPDVSTLCWINPSTAAYAPFAAWTSANNAPINLSNLTFVGGSCQWASNAAVLSSITAGYLFSCYAPTCTYQELTIVNNSFLGGFDLQASSGLIQYCYDMSQSRYQTDGTTVNSCQAAGFTFGGPVGAEGGVVNSCLGVGDWPITNCFTFDSNTGVNAPPTLISCGSSGGAFANVVPNGFNLLVGTGGMVAINCNAENCQTGFILSYQANAISCYILTAALAAFVVSNGELPWHATTQYYLNQEIIDTNGNYQQVTTAGTTGSTNPPTGGWHTVNGQTTTDGTVVWTKIANPGNFAVYNVQLNNCTDGLGANPISVYDIGTRTVYLSNDFYNTITNTDPAYVVVSGTVTVAANYTVKVSDNVVIVNAAGNTTTKLPKTGYIGQRWTVKNTNTGISTIQMVSGAATIDGQTTQLLLQNQSFDLEWDGTNFHIV